MIFKGYSHFPNIIAPTGPTGPSVTAAAFVANATGTNDVVTKFNTLLANLQAAGLMKTS